jgi:lipopolysaccharide biosynthesis glycosyltransferase
MTFNRNKNTFCTIITANYLPYAQALYYSLNRFNPEIFLQILISDVKKDEFKEIVLHEQCILYFTNEVCISGYGKQIFEKYHSTYHDGFRWSMKPVFLNFLVHEKKFEKVIYVDSDIHFFNDYTFLFEELNENNVLLTPHWRSINPEVDELHFKILFSQGLYNAGFIAINRHGVAAMEWWSKTCLFSCAKGSFEGQYDDQAYLDILPIYFDKVKVLKHRGCNVAVWNMVECNRVIQEDGNVLINNEYPIIFIHLVSNVLKEYDILLSNYVDKFLEILKIYSEEVYLKEKYNRENLPQTIVPRRRLFRFDLKQLYSSLLRISN